ncbi:helicase HerA domain-containing protein [Dinghuibacter silviterrae]|uniref:Uncharacterized protein DUF87 n=1 Tax=Dinghuibacter silviterrae TaxID=1539049 RepID=A0A4R8DG52_9BACT|nr:DUF87 domain-containing protein [Dinghuibacter silviterrae]TDW95940.1 uncharacterized protein DUF87 [Dinghuibacter silviterrae]
METNKDEAKSIFSKLIQKEQLVGDLYSINYEEGKVLVHDFFRHKVGGIPSLSFLIATRINPDEDIDFKEEDASVILLRVMDAAQIPQDREAEKVRIETAQRISGEADKQWDGDETMDVKTRHIFSYAGISCRIIGTFFLEEDESGLRPGLKLKFGSDISNYYSNKGFKIYKPNAEALEEIVNYCDPATIQTHIELYGSQERVKLGSVRYASTNRKYQKIDDVPVYIYPADLLSQKSALFGMTRTGKSNTTKIIAKSVFELRLPQSVSDAPLRIGQIIFDPNGEYANENAQDKDERGNPNALKNIWRQDPKIRKESDDLKNQYLAAKGDEQLRAKIKSQIKSIAENEVVTYGLLEHPRDPFRRLMKLNFHADDNLQIGKEIIDFKIIDQTAQYFRNFKQVVFLKPEESQYENEGEYRGQLKRYNRRVLVYRALLCKAGFAPPKRTVTIDGVFSKRLREVMGAYVDKKAQKKQTVINAAAHTLGLKEVSWDALSPAFEGLFLFLSTADFNTFNQEYINSNQSVESEGTGEGWAEVELESLLEMFIWSKAINLIGGVSVQHTTSIGTDYAKDIYDDLVKGKLVIVDQSSGEPELNKSSATRIMWHIFKGNQDVFRNGINKIPEILVYIEEAHNILPAGNDLDLSDVWVRTAKEGSKYHIGMVYATQEVSSVQKNILKNTANWFISHLNNADETKELCKYYDFEDFEPSIRRAQDKGFLRVKTLSNMFVIPVQVDKFDING